MAEYDSSYLAEQNLYGSSRDAGVGNGGGGMRYGGGGGGGGGGGNRYRGGRRSGGWNNGGGGGRGGGGSYAPRKDQVDPEEYHLRRTRDTLFRIGDHREGADDFHPPSELFRLKEFVEEQANYGGRALEGLFSAFRVVTTEQPHKTPLTAALLGFLTLSPRKTTRAEEPASEVLEGEDVEMAGEKSINFGIMLIKDLVSAFRTDLDARLWRNVRLLLHLFASLLPLGIIQSASLRSILLSFAAVLEEPGVTAARGDRAAVCIIETMCRAGKDLLGRGEEEKERAQEELDELVTRVQRYSTEYRHVEVDLVRPIALRQPTDSDDEDFLHEESLETAVEALVVLQKAGYQRPAFLPSPLDLLPPPIVAMAKETIESDCVITLPDILVPPDDEYAEGGPGHGIAGASSSETGPNGRARTQRRDKRGNNGANMEGWYRAGAGLERVPRYAKWFRETVPSSVSPAGVIMRSIFYDIIDLYQVNRKECARILFDSARWLRKGTFVGKSTLPQSGIFGEVEDQWTVGEDGTVEGGWNLDEIIVECILSTALVLPTPPQKPLYYTSLLREVVTLNPQSIAPAMGKSVRRVYNVMNTGRAEGETIRRFADWFSIHLSNFNFNWNWKEWIPDMDLPLSNPKLAFARRIIELEVRLAYHDRITTTLPEEIKARILPPEEPAPSFTYAAEGHPFRERALSLIQSLRARATAEVILAEMESFKKEICPDSTSSFLPSSDDAPSNGGVKVQSEEEAEIVIRDVINQAILSIGSRSFSHLLNVLEKYHPLLRQLTTSPEMRLVILSSTARFWSKSPQWIQICVDKMLQYRLVEPTDVVHFVFTPPTNLPALVLHGGQEGTTVERDWSAFNWWDLIKLTVNKVNGRVDQVQKRLEILERQELDKAEKLRAAEEAGDSTVAAAEEERKKLEKAKEGEKSKVLLFPSGVTTSTLPRRPDLPPLPNAAPPPAPAPVMTEEEKRGKAQTVEETRVLFTNVSNEQRRVLIDVIGGFLSLLQEEGPTSSVWNRSGQQDNSDAQWQLWWLAAWYREYCRLFNKFLSANHETIVANAFSHLPKDTILLSIFDSACQMASE